MRKMGFSFYFIYSLSWLISSYRREIVPGWEFVVYFLKSTQTFRCLNLHKRRPESVAFIHSLQGDCGAKIAFCNAKDYRPKVISNFWPFLCLSCIHSSALS